MGKFIPLSILLLYNLTIVCGESMKHGPGEWRIYHMSYKEGPVNELKIDLTQEKVNRETYAYSGSITTMEPLDDRYGVKMDICKYMDGGCKQFLVLTDESFVAFANKYAEESIKKCFSALGVSPAQLPLGQGEYKVDKFEYDVGELPGESTYGHFIAEACATKAGNPVGCILCELEFFNPDE